MNIDEMSDEQKSVMLARAMGWEMQSWPNESMVSIRVPPNRKEIFNLYDPANMSSAWRVRVEITEYRLTTNYGKWNKWRMRAKDWLDEPDAATVIRLWLDKILALAIEAGVVEVANV